MIELIPPRRSYGAKLFTVETTPATFKIAGTLDGFVDFHVGRGKTYPLTLDDCRALIGALNSVVADVSENCLYDRDALLERD